MFVCVTAVTRDACRKKCTPRQRSPLLQQWTRFLLFVFFTDRHTCKEQILSNAHTHHYIPFTWMQLWLTVFSGSGEAKQVTANASRHSLEISLVLKYHNKYDTDRIQTTTLSVSTLMTKGPCDKLTKEGLFVFYFFTIMFSVGTTAGLGITGNVLTSVQILSVCFEWNQISLHDEVKQPAFIHITHHFII